jgi:methionyl-tRNA formyltransferase
VGEVTDRIRVVLLSEVNSKFGAPFLADLLAHPEVEVAGVVTRAPGKLCSYYLGEQDQVDLAEQAASAGVPVLRPHSVNDPETVAALTELAPDYLLIANFQQILRKPVLAVPRRAVVNFHPSPLPRYAGLSPFFWMALNGERDAGVTALITTPGIDDGPVLAQRPVALEGTESAGEIRDELFRHSRRLLHEVIPRLVAGDLEAVPQDTSRRTYFSKPQAGDTSVDWSWDAEKVMRVVRACRPQPGALVASDALGLRLHDALVVPWEEQASSRPSPGEVRSDERHGLMIACADAWIQVRSLSWQPQETLMRSGGAEEVVSDLTAGLAGVVAAHTRSPVPGPR